MTSTWTLPPAALPPVSEPPLSPCVLLAGRGRGRVLIPGAGGGTRGATWRPDSEHAAQNLANCLRNLSCMMAYTRGLRQVADRARHWGRKEGGL